MKSRITERIVSLGREIGVLRPKDLVSLGLPPQYLVRLCSQGVFERVGRGLYVLADAEYSEKHTTAEVCKRVPHGVVCLVSALAFHNVTTQMPYQIWIAIDRTRRTPSEPGLPIRVFRFSEASMQAGVETHAVEGVPVQVFNVAKTVADCFKFRSRIGMDVCLESLRDVLRNRRCTRDEIYEYATICRVANVMRPYMEATV